MVLIIDFSLDVFSMSGTSYKVARSFGPEFEDTQLGATATMSID